MPPKTLNEIVKEVQEKLLNTLNVQGLDVLHGTFTYEALQTVLPQAITSAVNQIVKELVPEEYTERLYHSEDISNFYLEGYEMCRQELLNKARQMGIETESLKTEGK